MTTTIHTAVTGVMIKTITIHTLIIAITAQKGTQILLGVIDATKMIFTMTMNFIAKSVRTIK